MAQHSQDNPPPHCSHMWDMRTAFVAEGLGMGSSSAFAAFAPPAPAPTAQSFQAIAQSFQRFQTTAPRFRTTAQTTAQGFLRFQTTAQSFRTTAQCFQPIAQSSQLQTFSRASAAHVDLPMLSFC
mmetsp:Transcript_80531/g.134744  ORF Transcript_80531/g.134744 Transcript_80531/m.134744 type:complete len:125 (+) Transcript_80531:643-1017(+)